MNLTPNLSWLGISSDEIAQMVEQQTVVPEVSGSNPATGEIFCAMLQHSTSNRVYNFPTKRKDNYYIVTQM